MTWWIGSQAAIARAEALACLKVVGLPEYLEGVELPPEQWITKRWATPVETATAGVWSIPAHPDMPLPEGCELTETADWPGTAEGV